MSEFGYAKKYSGCFKLRLTIFDVINCIISEKAFVCIVIQYNYYANVKMIRNYHRLSQIKEK